MCECSRASLDTMVWLRDELAYIAREAPAHYVWVVWVSGRWHGPTRVSPRRHDKGAYWSWRAIEGGAIVHVDERGRHGSHGQVLDRATIQEWITALDGWIDMRIKSDV